MKHNQERTGKIKSVGTHLLKFAWASSRAIAPKKDSLLDFCFFHISPPWNWQRPLFKDNGACWLRCMDEKRENVFVKKSEKVINISAFSTSSVGKLIIIGRRSENCVAPKTITIIASSGERVYNYMRLHCHCIKTSAPLSWNAYHEKIRHSTLTNNSANVRSEKFTGASVQGKFIPLQRESAISYIIHVNFSLLVAISLRKFCIVFRTMAGEIQCVLLLAIFSIFSSSLSQSESTWKAIVSLSRLFILSEGPR